MIGSYEIEDSVLVRVRDAFIAQYGYTGPTDTPSVSAFIGSKVAEFLKGVVIAHESLAAAEAARAAAQAAATLEIEINVV